MGYYINRDSNGNDLGLNKAESLLQDEGVVSVRQPTEFVENLVCIVSNGFFEAAAYCYSEREFQEFARK